MRRISIISFFAFFSACDQKVSDPVAAGPLPTLDNDDDEQSGEDESGDDKESDESEDQSNEDEPADEDESDNDEERDESTSEPSNEETDVDDEEDVCGALDECREDEDCPSDNCLPTCECAPEPPDLDEAAYGPCDGMCEPGSMESNISFDGMTSYGCACLATCIPGPTPMASLCPEPTSGTGTASCIVGADPDAPEYCIVECNSDGSTECPDGTECVEPAETPGFAVCLGPSTF